MSGVRLHDFNCGFKAYCRIVIESVDIYGNLHHYIPCPAAQKGFRIIEIPYLFGRLGFLSGLSGFIICIYFTVLWFMGNDIGHRPISILGMLLFVTSIQLFSLGFLGDLFVKQNHYRNYDESYIKDKF